MTRLFLYLAFASSLCAAAIAQPCDPALVQDIPSLVPFSTVNTMTTWDPDRSGPLKERLVIAGDFTIANVANSNRIAAWDGSQWFTFGPGLTTAPTALASIFGKLIVAAGDIKPIGGASLGKMAQWNGTAWQSLPGGSVNGTVSAMRTLGDWLYVGGDFSAASGQIATNIARWNGLTWQKLGSGLNGTINAIEVFNGEIIAAGNFATSGSKSVRYVARWDGQEWQQFGSGPDLPVSSMTIHNGQLVVNSSGWLLNWDGLQWDLLNSEYNFNLPLLRSVHGKLYAAGYLDSFNSSRHVSSILCWDGVSWSNMQGGLFNGGSAARVSCLGEFGGDLYAMGQVTHGGTAPTPGIARWTGSSWRSIGSGMSKNSIAELLVAPDTVFAIDFHHRVSRWQDREWVGLPRVPETYYSYSDDNKSYFVVQGSLHAAFEDDGFRVFRLQSGLWIPVGEPFDRSVGQLIDFDGGIIASGSFTVVGGLSASGVAFWNGVQWLPMGAGFSANSLVVYHGQLYAIGKFAQSPASSLFDFARWDGTQWTPLDVNNSQGFQLLVYRDQIYARGGKSLFSWNGSAWTTLSAPVSGSLWTAAIFGGRLIVGGIGIGSPDVTLAEWTGTDWRPFGPSFRHAYLNSPGLVDSLAAFENTLFVGGDFEYADSNEAYYFARLSICSLCPADLNNDAIVDDADFCDFARDYDLMDCTDASMTAGCPADFNHDGFVDDADFTSFVAEYAAFLCPAIN